MTANQLHILQHSLGCDEYGRADRAYRDEGDGCFGHYRNRFISDPDPDLITLIEMGLMKDYGNQLLFSGMHYYSVTKLGIATMRAESPKPPKISRAKQRYLDYLRAEPNCINNHSASSHAGAS